MSFYDDVKEERSRQFNLWGAQSHPNGTGGPAAVRFCEIAQAGYEKAQREGKLTWADVFLEEAAEVLAESNEEALRAELVQVAAVCGAWVEYLDSKGSK